MGSQHVDANGNIIADTSGPTKPSYDDRRRAIKEQEHARRQSLQREHGWDEEKAKKRAREEMRPAVEKLIREKDW